MNRWVSLFYSKKRCCSCCLLLFLIINHTLPIVKMNIYFRLILLCLSLPILSFAQRNFKPGYIVTLKGDTIRGQINYREWNQTPVIIQFKNGSITEKYTPRDIAAFGLDNIDYYQSQQVSVSMDNVDYSKLLHHPDTANKKTEQIFLHVLTTGAGATLLAYTDSLKERFYIRTGQTTIPQELGYATYINDPADNGSQPIEKYIRQYQRQLIALASSINRYNSKLTGQISRSAYTKDDLVKIVNIINGNTGNAKNTATSHSGIRLFAGISAVQSKLKYSGGINIASSNQSSASYYSPKISIGADLLNNVNIGALIIRAELSLYATDLKDVAGTSASSLKQTNIIFTPQVIYNLYNAAAFKFYLGTGINIAFAQYSNNNYSFDIQDYNHTIVTFHKYISTATMHYSIPVKAGFVFHQKIELFGAYYTTATITNAITYSGNVNVLEAGLKYLF